MSCIKDVGQLLKSKDFTKMTDLYKEVSMAEPCYKGSEKLQSKTELQIFFEKILPTFRFF